MKNILFINGIPDDDILKINRIYKNGNIQWGGNGSTNISNFLQTNLFNRSTILFDTRMNQELPGHMIHGIFNQISDPDTHKITLQKADTFYQRVAKHVPFFNIPSQVMKTTRDNIYRLLQGINNLHIPKTVKIQPKSPQEIYEAITNEGFKFPVIFRQAGDHGGVSTIRVDDETEQFYPFALDGRDYYLTQFVEYAKDGIYRKYRLVVVKGEVFIRHVIFSDEWIIHSESRKYMQMHKEYEREEVKILDSFSSVIKPKIQATIDAIYQQLGLDYFGIDCVIDENFEVTVFEINANMNILFNNAKSSDNPWNKQIDTIKKALINMISKEAI